MLADRLNRQHSLYGQSSIEVEQQEPLSIGEIQAMLADEDLDVRVQAASHLSCPPSWRRELVLSILRAEREDEDYTDKHPEADYFDLVATSLGGDEDTDFLRAAYSIVGDDLEGEHSAWYCWYMAKNPGLPDYIYLSLMEDETGWSDGALFTPVWEGLLTNHRQPPNQARARMEERLLQAVGEFDHNYHLGPVIAGCHWAGAEVLLPLALELMSGSDGVALDNLARNPSLPASLIIPEERLTTDDDGLRSLYAAGLDARDEWAFDILSRDPVVGVRRALAANEKTPEPILGRLALDGYAMVRRAAWLNPASTETIRTSAALLGVEYADQLSDP